MAKLSDLYARGKPVAIVERDDAGEIVDRVIVYMAKINPVEQEEAARAGNARQAIVLAASRDHTSQQWLALEARALMKTPEELLSRLVEDHRMMRLPVCESRVAHEDEWRDDGYLDGLRDAWASGLADRYAANPEDDEAAHVFAELKRFTEQLDLEVAAEVNPFERDLRELTPATLQDRWCEEELKLRGLMAFNVEYFRQCLLAAVREPCEKCAEFEETGQKHVGAHTQRYFLSDKEIDTLDIQVRAQLQMLYNGLTVAPTEGKDSPPLAASSQPLEPAALEATDASSGPTDVAA